MLGQAQLDAFDQRMKHKEWEEDQVISTFHSDKTHPQFASRRAMKANILEFPHTIGMQVPVLVHPVNLKDDNARKAGCTCNHRSSQPSGKHHPDCIFHR